MLNNSHTRGLAPKQEKYIFSEKAIGEVVKGGEMFFLLDDPHFIK